jgi:hypothetical protein
VRPLLTHIHLVHVCPISLSLLIHLGKVWNLTSYTMMVVAFCKAPPDSDVIDQGIMKKPDLCKRFPSCRYSFSDQQASPLGSYFGWTTGAGIVFGRASFLVLFIRQLKGGCFLGGQLLIWISWQSQLP